jgi:signal transduction histidine kinase
MLLDFRALPILYVDGDPACAALFREIVGASERFAVLTANSASQALRAIELSEIALLVADQTLPDMSATVLFEQVRKTRPDILRLLTSSHFDPGIAEEAINRGRVCGYMAKPWQPEKLRAWLATTLESMLRDSRAHTMEMSLWHGGQVAAATTIYEELVHELSNPLGALEINASLVADLLREISAQPALSGGTSGQVGHVDVGQVELDGVTLDIAALRESVQTAFEAHTDSLAAIEQMKNLVSRMRYGGRPKPRSQGTCDPARVIEATVRVVRAEVENVAQLEVRVEAHPTVQIEASVLGQILLNLLLNAAQAVPVDNRPHNRIQVLAVRQAEQLLICVRDNGPGIAPGLQERVFEPFFTTKENGTGLGLAICRELVTRAHGTISVSSRPDGGAQFDIRIPVAK